MLTAQDIVGLALRDADAVCKESLDILCRQLGAVAGNLALTLGARGGVYIGGGVVTRLGGFLGRSGFRSAFEAKGRFEAYLAQIPTWVIRADQPALMGAAWALGIGKTRA